MLLYRVLIKNNNIMKFLIALGNNNVDLSRRKNMKSEEILNNKFLIRIFVINMDFWTPTEIKIWRSGIAVQDFIQFVLSL